MIITTTKINCYNSHTLVTYQITSDADEFLKEITEIINYASVEKKTDPVLLAKIELVKAEKLAEFEQLIADNFNGDIADFVATLDLENRRQSEFKGKQLKLVVNYKFAVRNLLSLSVEAQTNPDIDYDIKKVDKTKYAYIYLDSIDTDVIPILLSYPQQIQIYDFNKGLITSKEQFEA